MNDYPLSKVVSIKKINPKIAIFIVTLCAKTYENLIIYFKK